MNEIWKPVLGYEGLYEASNLGNIRSIKREGTPGKILKPSPHYKWGYYHVGICGTSKTVHKLVWEAFNGPIPEGLQINHINENRQDNRLCNLNLMTPKENSNWGTRGKKIQESNSIPILCYDKEGNFIREYMSAKEAERILNIKGGQAAICRCLKGRIPSAYGFVWKYA